MKLAQTQRLKAFKLLPVAMVCGILVSFATGLFRRNIMSIPETKHYGNPLIWRVTDLNGPTEYVLSNLAVDSVFWIIISLLAFTFLVKILKNPISPTVAAST